MTKLFLVLGVAIAVTTAVRADSFTHVVYTSDCRPAAMQALMDRVSAENRDVITKVICDAPSYQANYNTSAPYAYGAIDYSSVPVVDCVPGPIVSSCGCLY